MELAAPRVQLNDFKLEGWSLVEKKQKAPAKPLSVEEVRAQAKQAAAQGQKLLSPEVLRSIDAFLDVAVEEVLSGADKLGSGTLKAQLSDGKFVLDPAEVNVPGVSARIAFSYQPTDTDVACRPTSKSIGSTMVLARRIKPGTDMQGLFIQPNSTRVKDAGRPDAACKRAHRFCRPAADFKSAFRSVGGEPFVALLPAVDPASGVQDQLRGGSLHLARWQAHPGRNLRTPAGCVSGVGKVDFATEELAFRLAPKAKSPQFFTWPRPAGDGPHHRFQDRRAGSD
jgi:hypothetical protein